MTVILNIGTILLTIVTIINYTSDKNNSAPITIT